MKRYAFRLDPVLKLRKLKEENCRMELGQLLMELNRIEDQLAHDRNEIDNYYKIQEGALKTGMSGSQLQAFPMLISAKTKNLELLERDKKRQNQKVEEKKQELAQLRGDLKVMENMKQKDYDEYRKALTKKSTRRSKNKHKTG